MELTILIAKVYAILLASVGLGLIFSPAYDRKALDQMLKEGSAVYLGGSAALVVGVLILTYHWVWTGWPVLVTLLGVIGLLKGLGLLVFPGVTVRATKAVTKHPAFIPLWGAFAFVLGIIFAYVGWVVQFA
jgi:uncharacterized protein YjeT (DUF2065 family)